MNQIYVEGQKIEYFGLNDLIGGTPAASTAMINKAAEVIIKNNLQNTCRLFISPLNNTSVMEYLYWFKEINLLELDQKILDENYSDEDFSFSVRTYFLKGLFCTYCKQKYSGGLAIDPVSYWFNQIMGKEKLKIIKHLNKLKPCPNCGKPFRILVIHVCI